MAPDKCICPLGKVLTYKNLIYLLNFPIMIVQKYCEETALEIDAMSRRVEEAVNDLIEIFEERSGFKTKVKADLLPVEKPVPETISGIPNKFLKGRACIH